ncbi:hypothetical protein CC1G_07074 [Coprinopsis cinerea okayama7|uniref:SART-1 protein n=1 Tax=Coprinopsis cinerea (strain Okayama-7 / 130 / ATCC MYA-4618 / FGSC 9003) TaxID=240176 RepID=A8NUD0_COPC7|nr:hypothetical protein CC1G_07074 [Coprinopsis cinerea okayama7\|eukprot:XP_001836427.2 hypothetical protein CC1G_07074 [Coprinopsis cinerea okayama7\
MSMEQSISLEETNKIRISLGLKPLTDDKAPTEDKEKTAEENYAKLREKEAKEREAKQIQDRIAKVRNRRELNASLKGATLGDADGDVDDTLKWLKRSKKKEKELAKKRQKELEEMDKAIQAEYSERDLAGLKVSHDFDELGEGEDRILTLKDSQDELQNIEMAEEERRKKNQELRIKKRDYTGYDDDEFVEGAQFNMKRSILAKYDEEIEGPKQSEFRLGSSTLSRKAKQEEAKQQAAAAVNKSLLSIDYAKNLETADYLQEGDVGFKKPKTKKKRSSRRAPLDPEDGDDKMDVDVKPVPIERDLNANFVDDDDLQAALARSRKAKLAKAKRLSPEELAKKIAEQRARESAEVKHEEEDEGGLVFDETSEFVQAVGVNPIVKPKQEPKEPQIPDATEAKPARRSESRDVSMAPGDVPMHELEAGEVRVKDEEDEEMTMAMLDDIETAFKDEEKDVKQEEEDLGVGTSSEQTFNSGMAATLNILRQQGILAAPTEDQLARERTQKQRDLWLAEQRFKIAKKELEKYKGNNRDQAQREYDNRLREVQERRQNMEDFNNGYKPDVNIAYYDEHGRELSVKEAWKALSHKFHGKGPGKMKTEKKLKKIAEEKKKLAMASGDTPLSMNKAFQQRQEKLGQAHFVLSVGNRGAIPQAAEFLETQPLQKGKTEKTKKKKESKAGQLVAEGGFMTLPAPAMQTISNGTSGSGSASGSPAPKPGFSRISSVAATPINSEPQSQGGTPVPPDRVKVAFGLGVKRKAGEEAAGSPPPKRR